MTELERLIDITAKLRAEDGCLWDREQTHESLKPCVIEEVLINWDEIKAREKTGKEPVDDKLPDAFNESIELIGKAKERKGFK